MRSVTTTIALGRGICFGTLATRNSSIAVSPASQCIAINPGTFANMSRERVRDETQELEASGNVCGV